MVTVGEGVEATQPYEPFSAPYEVFGESNIDDADAAIGFNSSGEGVVAIGFSSSGRAVSIAGFTVTRRSSTKSGTGGGSPIVPILDPTKTPDRPNNIITKTDCRFIRVSGECVQRGQTEPQLPQLYIK